MFIIRSLMLGVAKSKAAIVARAANLLLYFLVNAMPGLAADFPQAEISNGQITAKIYLPDAKHGYYRSTRFDWSGAVYSLQYRDHNFYGPWFDRIDPKVINWVCENGQIVSGPCSGLWGPVDEFQIPLGFEEAKPGGTFIKIGVGQLRKTAEPYNRYYPYEVVNPGKWSVKAHKDSVEFTQELTDPGSGYAYVYRKVVRLVKAKPEMVIERSLKNIGTREIKSTMYDHNFVVLDKQTPGPDFTFQVPFAIQTQRQPNQQLAEIKGDQIVFQKPLSGEDQLVVFIQGFNDSANDNEVTISNSKVGAGVKISVDRPLVQELLWSIRTVLAVEPYVAIDVQPGAEFLWNNTFDYFTRPAGR